MERMTPTSAGSGRYRARRAASGLRQKQHTRTRRSKAGSGAVGQGQSMMIGVASHCAFLATEQGILRITGSGPLVFEIISESISRPSSNA